MSWIITILLAIAMFVTLISVGIGVDTMRHYKRVLAKLIRSDYSAMERHYDHLADRESDGRIAFKRTSMRLEFDTHGQENLRVHHKRWELSGTREKSCYFIWYHGDDPQNTRANGPGFWLVIATVSASVAITILLDPTGWQELIRGLWV